MNSLIPPANPSDAYRAQLAALIQLGVPMTAKIPSDALACTGVSRAVSGVEAALLTLQVELMKEETKQ